jgi:hypothetical protein
MGALNPYRTLEAKGWEEYVSIYSYYDGKCSDSMIMVLEYCSDDNLRDRIIKFLEAVERSSEIYSWNYDDDTIVDYDDNMAYKGSSYYGTPNVIYLDYEILGKARIDREEYDKEWLFNEFTNNPLKAVPDWFPSKILEDAGFEKKSCEFASGWYNRHDDPKEIMEKANLEGYDVIFQIDYAQPFEIGFCLWVKADLT